MFDFLKKKKPQEQQSTQKHIVEAFLSRTLSDETLSLPVWLPEIESEDDANNIGLAPMVYIWNVDDESGTCSISVNGKCVGHLLESFIPRSDPRFNDTRDEIMRVLNQSSVSVITHMVSQSGLSVKTLFAAKT